MKIISEAKNEKSAKGIDYQGGSSFNGNEHKGLLLEMERLQIISQIQLHCPYRDILPDSPNPKRPYAVDSRSRKVFSLLLNPILHP